MWIGGEHVARRTTNVIPAPRVPGGHERDQAGTHAHPSLLSGRIMRHHARLLLRRRIIMAYRQWKIRLIESTKPDWIDLFDGPADVARRNG
jgi:hypothetical protein